MRCPKRGYISFDHLDSCSKCSTDLAVTSEEVHGVAFKGEGISFLTSIVKAGGNAPAGADEEIIIDSDEPIALQEVTDELESQVVLSEGEEGEEGEDREDKD